MSRTTPENVKLIVEVDETSVPDLTPFITFANELVTEFCADEGYSAERLEIIERWLAAHFYCVRDPRSSSEGAGGVSASYQGSTGMHLDLTTYGQQAMLLDTAGGLASLNSGVGKGNTRKVGTVIWLGDET
jgi:hypothetical protein